ncbi:MAG: PD-(D/E)XK nuclease family protein, partial [Firmicutes bacterium]|nr:PD-(D/E)XK nuclease family protein [Bacillota bacterium]
DPFILMEEKMGIYRNLSDSAEKLYISYSMSDLDGNSSKPSSVWMKLREIFPEAEVKKDAVSDRNMKLLLNGAPGGLKHMANALERYTEGEPLPEFTEAGLDWYKIHDPGKLESIRRGLSFTNKAEDLGRDMASRLFRRDPAMDMSISPSRLEKFSRCPFSHFVSYGLKPEERRVFQVAPREIGDVYHSCLMKLTERLTMPGLPLTDPASPWMTITDDELREMAEGFVKEETSNYREGLFKLGKEEEYRTSRMNEAVVEVCRNLVEQVRAGAIMEGRFEASFGRGQKIPPIAIDTVIDGKHEKAYIEGKIDRVDYLPDSRVKIIDYKTGNEKFSIKEAEKGYRLQLMLYLEAALGGEKKPAGVFYFHISEPMINMTGKGDPESDPKGVEELKKAIAKEFKLNGILVDDPQVIKSIAGDFEGFSEIIPVRVNKDGDYSSTGKGEGQMLTEDQFSDLRGKVADTVSEKVAELLKGKVAINPMKTKDRSACTYCEYKGICRFDTIFEGNKWNPVD